MGALTVGQQLLGKLRVMRKIGSGGCGEVYEVEHEITRHRRALKVLRPGVKDNPLTLERFLREASAAGRIGNAHIAETFDAGFLEDGSPYLLMELLSGESLNLLLQKERQLPIALACNVLAQCCEALQSAHETGIVHRDLKPENLFLLPGAPHPFVKVIDFGISKFALELPNHLGLTEEGLTFGTPRYMAPEQMRGARDVDGRSDIYSLGVILYECLAGARPYDAPSFTELAMLVMSCEPAAVSFCRTEVPAALSSVVARAMRKDPADRFQDVRAFRAALLPFLNLEATPEAARPARAPSTTLELTDVRRVTSSALPVPSGKLIGRTEELAALLEALGADRLLTVVGARGAGKSRLALEAVARLGGKVVFVDASAAREVEGLSQQLVRALGGTQLAARGDALLFLDGAEWLSRPAVELISAWMRAAPQLRVLTTSMRRLRLEGERIFELPPFKEAVALFVDRATTASPGFKLDDSNRAAVDALVAKLDALPLAIEFAAARTAVLGPAQLVERLKTGFDVLRIGEGPRESLKGIFDSTWQLLSDVEQRALEQLSVFRGGCSVEAAEAVIVLEGQSVLNVLQSLRELSLVRIDGSGRVQLGPCIHAYAAARLAEGSREASDALTERFLRCFERLSASMVAAYEGPEGFAVQLRGQADRANLAAVIDLGLARGHVEAVVNATLAIDPLYTSRGPGPEHLALLGKVIAAVGAKGPPATRGLLLLTQANALVTWVHLQDGLKGYELAAATEPGPALMTRIRYGKGIVLFLLNHREEAAVELAAALAAAQSSGDVRTMGRIERHLGFLDDAYGRTADAEAHHERALSLHRQAQDPMHEGITLANLGAMAAARGAVAQAAGLYDAALKLHRQVGNRRSEGLLLTNLGLLLLDEGGLAQARVQLEEGLAVNREIKNRRFEGFALLFLGIIELLEGRFAQGEAMLRDVVIQFRELGAENDQATALAFRALGASGLGQPEKADQYLEQAEALVPAGADLVTTAVSYVCRGGPEAARGLTAPARERLKQVMSSRVGPTPPAASSELVRLAARCLAVILRRIPGD